LFVENLRTLVKFYTLVQLFVCTVGALALHACADSAWPKEKKHMQKRLRAQQNTYPETGTQPHIIWSEQSESWALLK